MSFLIPRIHLFALHLTRLHSLPEPYLIRVDLLANYPGFSDHRERPVFTTRCIWRSSYSYLQLDLTAVAGYLNEIKNQ